MIRLPAFCFLLFSLQTLFAQLPVARDTITVLENNRVLKMPWAGGINNANVSNADLNFDGKPDLVVFDRMNAYGTGRFRCFLNTGSAGQTNYRADPSLSYYFPEVYNWAVLIDYNKDGKEDLFCSIGTSIRVYKNTSTPANVLQFTLVKSQLYSDFNPNGNPYIADIFASVVGVPGISDIDNDGDIDILTFSPFGSLIEFHKNIAVENNLNADSLVFEMTDPCWGRISEGNCTVSFNQCVGSSSKPMPTFTPDGKPYHAGSCLMCFDSDGDGDKDLLMGDIACNDMQYIHNAGGMFNDTTKRYPNYPIKGNTTPIRINNFPCSYAVDVDGDGRRDLVASPNAFGSENTKSLWYYKNVSTNSVASFTFVKNNLFQDEMIEVGQNAFPLLLDVNADGKKDLLLGTYGYYNNNSLSAKLTYYQNTGTSTQPAYSLVSRDYAALSNFGLSNCMPTAGDIDNDGDIDLCIGTSNGKIHWVENTAGAGNSCNFSNFKNNPFNITTVSSNAAPQLFDLDNDGKLDLLIGTKNGRLSYYRNTGTSAVPAFSLVTAFLGSVQVQGDPLVYLNDGFATPYFYRENNNVFVLVGSIEGNIYHYAVPAQVTNGFTLLNANTNNLNEGSLSVPFYDDANNDGKRDLLVGNASGGLSFFSSASPFVGINEIAVSDQIKLYPNPVNDELFLQLPSSVTSAMVQVYNMQGDLISESPCTTNCCKLTTVMWPKGLYLVKVSYTTKDGQNNVFKKLLKD